MTQEHHAEHEQVWLVDRTYSDDEQNIVILIYATTDGGRYLRKERAITSFSDSTETPAAVNAKIDNLGTVTDSETKAEYAVLAQERKAAHDPDDIV